MYMHVIRQISRSIELQTITNMFMSKLSDGGPIDSETKYMYNLNKVYYSLFRSHINFLQNMKHLLSYEKKCFIT